MDITFKKITAKKVDKFHRLKKSMYKNARYLDGSYIVKFKGKFFASDNLDTLFNDVKQEYIKIKEEKNGSS